MLVELMRRMIDYRYDPTGSFRGWLWRLFRFRALNLIKERREELAHLVDLAFLDRLAPPYDPVDDEPDERFLARLREAEAIHRAVERRVKPARWQAYLKIAIFGERIGDVAAELGMKYGSAYAAAQYVEGMVREEASKRRTGQTLFP
jgi:DNA-directed RNA polymerase specialized sigma24 family protein